MSLLIVGLDNTIVNIALPSIRAHLHASVSGLQWTIDAYTLVLASLLILSRVDRRPGRPAADLPDRSGLFSPRLAALQPGAEPGLADRVPGAAGGRRLDAQPGGACRSSRTRSPSRASGPGRSASGARWSASAWRVGPLIGGVLVDSVGWRSIFWINVPVGIAAIVLARLLRARVAVAARRAGSTRSARCWCWCCCPPDVRDHRRAGPRLDRRPTSSAASPSPRPRWSGSWPTSRGARSRCSTCASSAARRSPERPCIAVCAFGVARRFPLPQHALPAGRPRLRRRCTPASTRCRWR